MSNEVAATAATGAGEPRLPPPADLSSITPYKLTLLALVCEYCQWRRAAAGGATVAAPLTAQWRHTASRTLVELVYGAECGGAALGATLRRRGLHRCLLPGLGARLCQLYRAGPEGVAELVGGAELLIVEHGPGRAPIACSSVLGLFLRAVILAYARLSFSQAAQVFEEFAVFYRHSRMSSWLTGDAAAAAAADDSTAAAADQMSLGHSDMASDYSEDGSPLPHTTASRPDSFYNNRWLARRMAQCAPPPPSLPLSGLQARNLITSQLQLLQLNETAAAAATTAAADVATNAVPSTAVYSNSNNSSDSSCGGSTLSADQLCQLMAAILRQAPSSLSALAACDAASSPSAHPSSSASVSAVVAGAHCVAMLACARATELCGALNALYQSFDRSQRAASLAHAPLALAALHWHFDQRAAARSALREALTMARDTSLLDWCQSQAAAAAAGAEAAAAAGGGGGEVGSSLQLVSSWLCRELDDWQLRGVLLRRAALTAAAAAAASGSVHSGVSCVAGGGVGRGAADDDTDLPHEMMNSLSLDGAAAAPAAAVGATAGDLCRGADHCLAIINYVRLLSDTAAAPAAEQLSWLVVAGAAGVAGDGRSAAAVEATRAAVLSRHGRPGLALLCHQLLLYSYAPPPPLALSLSVAPTDPAAVAGNIDGAGCWGSRAAVCHAGVALGEGAAAAGGGRTVPLSGGGVMDCRQVACVQQAACRVAEAMAEDGQWLAAERCLDWAERATYSRVAPLVAACRVRLQCERAVLAGDCGALLRLTRQLRPLEPDSATRYRARAALLLGQLSCAEQLAVEQLQLLSSPLSTAAGGGGGGAAGVDVEAYVNWLVLLAEIYCAAGEAAHACDILRRAATVCGARHPCTQRWHVQLRLAHALLQLQLPAAAGAQLAAVERQLHTHGSCVERARLLLLQATLPHHQLQQPPAAALNRLQSSCRLLQRVGGGQLLKRVLYCWAMLCHRAGDQAGRNEAAKLFRKTVSQYRGVSGSHLCRTLY